MKKYVTGTGNIMLIAASLSTASIILSFVIFSQWIGFSQALDVILSFAVPFSFLCATGLITVFSKNLRHCAILGSVQIVSILAAVWFPDEQKDEITVLVLVISAVLLLLFFIATLLVKRVSEK